MKSVGKKVKMARKAAGLTQTDLAERTKLSRSHIGAIEIDHYNPSLATLTLIANALGISISDLLDDSETDKKPTVQLENEEIRLVNGYRELNKLNKKQILNMISAFLVQQAAM